MAEVGEGSMCRGAVVSLSRHDCSHLPDLLGGWGEVDAAADCSGVFGSELLASESFSASETGLRSSMKDRSRCLNPANDPGRSGEELDAKG